MHEGTVVFGSKRSHLIGLLLLIAASTPLAFALENVLRQWLLPPQFEEVRVWLCATLTPWAWATVGLTAAAVALGWWMVGALYRKAKRRPSKTDDPTTIRARASLEAVILASSTTQLPALAATMLYMMGAPLLPTAVSIGVATVGVLSMVLWLPREAAADQSEPPAA